MAPMCVFLLRDSLHYNYLKMDSGEQDNSNDRKLFEDGEDDNEGNELPSDEDSFEDDEDDDDGDGDEEDQ